MGKPFNKYDLYIRSVQSPDTDVAFFENTYRKLRNGQPQILREDFCGTFAVSSAWVRKRKTNQAIGIDLDPEPIRYGREHFFNEMTEQERKRLFILSENVLSVETEPADIVAALNFSYFLFKERKSLGQYFCNARKGLRPNGIFVVDCFGGPACQERNEESRRLGNFTYYWDQASYNPIKNEAIFHIHFKRKGEKKRRNVFTYDWRLWSIAELRELMLEAGFAKTVVYWEGTSRKTGEGNGVFRQTETGEDCQAWVAYIVGLK